MTADRLVLDAGSLKAMLARMAGLARSEATRAVFVLEGDTLVVEWGGAQEELSGEGSFEPTVLAVSAATVAGLAQSMSGSGRARVSIDGDRIQVNTTSIRCERLPRRPPQLLPTDAGRLDVLVLRFKESSATISEAGLQEELDAAWQQARRSIGKAANELAWLKVSAELLESWIAAHLCAVARGEQTFELGRQALAPAPARTVVVDDKGQVILFDRPKR